MLGFNGGLLGVRRVPTTGAAKGLWFPNEQSVAKRAAIWPTKGDPYWTDVSLLLPMNGSNGSTTFTDASSNALTVTANGNAQISTAQSKFGGASGLFDGTGDFLTISNNALFTFGAGDLTIECWIYIAGNSGLDLEGKRNAAICSTWPEQAPISGWLFGIAGSSSTTGTGLFLNTWPNTGAVIRTNFASSFTISQSAWHHVALTISGGTRRLFFNGELQEGSTDNLNGGFAEVNSYSNDLQIARNRYGGYHMDLNGYIDDLRITKGVARYTANFTPPAAPFPDA